MRARLFLLLILLLVTTSFFWEDEEKQLRQLHQNGETALQKKEYEAAKKAFEELLSRISVTSSQKYQVDWLTYGDVAMRLAGAYDELHEKDEASRVLCLLLAKNPPEEIAMRAKLMKARLSATQESPAEAFFEMNQLAKQLPFEYWSNQELTFYHALEHSLDIYYDELMRKAKLHMMAHLYAESAALYEEILTAIEKKCYPKAKPNESLIAKTVHYRLAECYFLAAQYEQSLKYLNTEACEDAIDREMIYLSALCYKEKSEYEKAIELFHHYTHLGEPGDLDHYDCALFEIGHHYYQKGQMTKARRYFERLHNYEKKPSRLAALALARIYLDEKVPKEAEKILESLAEQLASSDPLSHECDYLRGMAAFALGEYGKAHRFFERATHHPKNSKWTAHCRYHLGWCNVRLGDDVSKDETYRHAFFDQAEEVFQSLKEGPLHEEASLSLGQVYVLVFHHFKTEETLTKLDTLLSTSSFSLQGELEALILRAEVATTYLEKEKLYAQATDAKFQHAPLYARAWYCRGLNHFSAGLQDPTHPAALFESAASAFEKAFRSIETSEKEFAAGILKMEAKANLCRKSPITSLALLEKLLSQFDENLQEREDTLYLKGLLASQLPSSSYFPVAEEALSQALAAYPEGKYHWETLFALGTLYYQNQQYNKAQAAFCQLASENPESPYAAQSWFWAAEAASQVGENAMAMRRHVYEDYPDAPQAAEAYFKLYPYSRYGEGNPESIHHLKEFAALFPESPLNIVVYYLLGYNEEKLESAKSSFDKSLAAFSQYQDHCPKLENIYVHFRYQALLEIANRYLEDGLFDECETRLIAFVNEFAEPHHPLTGLLKQKSNYPSLYEEGEFKLVQCYLKQGKESSAQKKLQTMLEHYDAAGIHEGHYLSLVWLEQGRLSMRCGDQDTALNCFEIALGCLPPEQVSDSTLTLWLLQSECYREKKEYGTSMRLLSKVINAETASPLRLKAMFLRSEIYELEERPELAIRQLEAMAKKGGDWAAQAKDKLKRVYGVE